MDEFQDVLQGLSERNGEVSAKKLQVFAHGIVALSQPIGRGILG